MFNVLPLCMYDAEKLALAWQKSFLGQIFWPTSLPYPTKLSIFKSRSFEPALSQAWVSLPMTFRAC